MEKRIHRRRSESLSYRNYLLHFKWLFLSICFICIFTLLHRMKFQPFIFLSTQHDNDLELSFTDVFYPIDVADQKNVNKSILFHFSKKEELKIPDDAKSIDRQEKVVIPWTDNRFLSNKYLILEFTKVFERPRFCSRSKEEIFGKTCPYKNCDYTCDQKHEEDADVLLMHKRDLNFQELDSMPRNKEQIWLLWHDEPNEKLENINKYKFNWTITYRTSAEASLGAYGITLVKNIPWSKEKLNSWIDEEFNKRYNQAIWFVSNCKPKRRLAKFLSLRQHYPIVAFGKCISPNHTYSLNAKSHSNTKCDRRSNCEQSHLSTSKFYLAFESQSCTDYITEKFWRTLSVGAIPIVSGPERNNFARIAPPKSFVHIDDYASESELSEALNLIATNRTLYGKYHAWRRYYDVYFEAKDVDPYRFCELCYRLNTNKQRIWYENINDWFLSKC